MEETIKGLLEKIQQEGIVAAQEKALGIERRAQQEAESILASARKEAERLIAEAALRLRREEASTRATLVQACRDMVILVRKEVEEMLQRIITVHIRQALSSQELAGILKGMVKEKAASSGYDIVIGVSPADAEHLKKAFLGELAEEAKKGIVLTPREDIRAGFTISYDAGKSCFDFTDLALAGYIGNHLKPKLAELLASGASKKD